jgi:hypothetical protein
MDLLRWCRFVWAIEIPWDRVTAVEARDFCRWIQLADKPAGVSSRRRGDDELSAPPPASVSRGRAASPNPVTGKPVPGDKYAATTVAHCVSPTYG